MNIDPEKVRSLFLQAVEHHAPKQWSSFLDGVCGEDQALRERIEILLHAHEQANSLLDAPDRTPVSTLGEPIPESPGTVIGNYKLLEQIGEGGFGIVYMAEQTEPVKRKVALKILKPGMDTRQIVSRFEAERQALAVMDHPNIAHIFDGGATESGRPYFVMELVKGVPITEYCDDHKLDTRDRLKLFGQVCQAVQHAHQKGIIHRDIKPSNVIVSSHDGKPVVKVIDFGIAKAMSGSLTDKTLFTGFAQMIGTPLYMSPEQAGMSDLDVDTRSDIYSLGVLLYELLTGTTPFNKERLQRATYDEIRRIIREEEPLRPSARISTLGKLATTASEQRKADPRRLSLSLRGELDWIVMKALEKDRNRRYETASSFAADVERYLRDEPVQARLASASYRLKKLIQRNKGATIAVLIIFTTILAGVGGTTMALFRARDAEAKAVDDRNAKEDALKREMQEHQRAEINLQLAYKAIDDIYFRIVEEELPKHPERLQEYNRILTAALEFHQKFAKLNAGREVVRFELSTGLARSSQLAAMIDDHTMAISRLQEALPQAETLARQNPETSKNIKLLAGIYLQLGNSHYKLGQLKKAEVAFETALQVIGTPTAETARTFCNVSLSRGNLLMHVGKHSAARKAYEEGLQQAQLFTSSSPPSDQIVKLCCK